MARVRLDIDGIVSRVERAVIATADDYFQAHQDAIRRKVYPHPNPTRRKNGSVVGSPRDIVDTSTLIRSGKVIYTATGYKLVWRARHAGYVFRGVRSLPPKNWHVEADKEFSIAESVQKNLR
jgi:hypothetical protein